MVKAKTVYVCSNCGADSPKWIGKCPSCGEWNTYVEEIVVKEPVGKRALYGVSDGGKVRPVLLRDITSEEETRVDLGDLHSPLSNTSTAPSPLHANKKDRYKGTSRR